MKKTTKTEYTNEEINLRSTNFIRTYEQRNKRITPFDYAQGDKKKRNELRPSTTLRVTRKKGTKTEYTNEEINLRSTNFIRTYEQTNDKMKGGHDGLRQAQPDKEKGEMMGFDRLSLTKRKENK